MLETTRYRYTVPFRRLHTVIRLEWGGSTYYVGFGQEADRRTGRASNPRVVEVFADGRRSGSDQQAQLSDACIAISLLLQHGVPIATLTESFGELRNEGEVSGRPASILGLIAWAGAALEKETAELTAAML